MKNKLYVYTGVFLFALLIILVIYGNETVRSRKASGMAKSISAEEKKEQEISVNKRKILYRLNKTDDFTYEGSAVSLWYEFEGNLVILDESTQKFGIYSSQGKLLRSFGITGPAPWENVRIRDMHPEDDNYYVVDNQLMTVKSTSFSGKVNYYRKLNDMIIWDGIHLTDDRFLVLNDDPDHFGMQVVHGLSDSHGNIQLLRDMVFEKKDDPNFNIVYEGKLLRGESIHFYVCSRAGLFMAFNKDGTYLYTAETIDQTPPPDVTARTTGNVTYFVREPDAAFNYAASVDAAHLYILSLVAFKNTTELSVDVYEASTGSYTFSFVVPNHGSDLPINILAGEDHFYVLYEDLSVEVFELEKQ